LKLTRIAVKQFRNYTDREFVCSDSGAIVLGPNGSGKTNFFEAIAYCSLGKSVKYQTDDLVVQFDKKHFSIQADFNLRLGNCNIQIDYTAGKKKISINGIPIKQLSQIYEYVKVIYCSPEDIYLVNGSPRTRRMYFDMAIAQLKPTYIVQLRQYLHIVEQRNILLKDIANQKQKKHWDELFINAALPVIGARLEYISKLNEKIKTSYKHLLTEADILNINYIASLNPVSDDTATLKYTEELARLESREWQYQRTLLGPHLDDYNILFETRAVKDIGSQGQKRTVTLLIKIAQLELIKDVIGEYPILLLDDIFAELDKEHTHLFMQILRHHEQVFIASPNAITSTYWAELPVIDLAEAVVQA
jgi:DNA replication and repair protein RecF